MLCPYLGAEFLFITYVKSVIDTKLTSERMLSLTFWP